MKNKISSIIFLGVLFLLSSCAEHNPEIVIVTRQVVITKVVTPEVLNSSEIAYDKLPPLDGNPSDLLVNSRWQLERFIVNNMDSPIYVNDQWLQFEETSWSGFDGCNRISGAYKSNQEGDLLLNFGLSTLLACSIIDDENKEEQSVGDREFVQALESAVAFEIVGSELWIFYSVDQMNSLVFSAQEINKN